MPREARHPAARESPRRFTVFHAPHVSATGRVRALIVPPWAASFHPPSRKRNTSSAKEVRPVKRRHLVELEDLPWWPRVFRDAATDYLVTALRLSRTYTPLVPRLADAIGRSGATQVTDLCSGGGGPWPEMLPALRARGAD